MCSLADYLNAFYYSLRTLLVFGSSKYSTTVYPIYHPRELTLQLPLPVNADDLERRRLQIGVEAYPGEWPSEASEVEEEAGLPAYFFLPVLALVIITILNDGTLITVAYDNVVPGKLPEVSQSPSPRLLRATYMKSQ